MTGTFTALSEPTTSCEQCGATLPATGRYCGECGAPSSAQPPDTVDTVVVLPQPVADEPTASKVPPRRSRIRLVAMGAVMVIALAAVIADDVAKRGALDRTRKRLAATQRTLADTSTSLTATQTELTSTESDLATTQTALGESKKSVATLQQQLAGVRNSLTDAKGKVEVQATQIVTLKTCLDGVSSALSDVAYGNYDSALAALDAVRVSCQAANDIVT